MQPTNRLNTNSYTEPPHMSFSKHPIISIFFRTLDLADYYLGSKILTSYDLPKPIKNIPLSDLEVIKPPRQLTSPHSVLTPLKSSGDKKPWTCFKSISWDEDVEVIKVVPSREELSSSPVTVPVYRKGLNFDPVKGPFMTVSSFDAIWGINYSDNHEGLIRPTPEKSN